MAISALSAATTACEASNWRLSNLELQKLLYLAHRTYMGRHDGAHLINEEFEAWPYGPVLPSLYAKTKGFGNQPITFLPAVNRRPNRPEHQIVREVVNHFKGTTPSELVALTHIEDGGWDRNFISGVRHCIIPDEDIIHEYAMVNRERV